ncbi:MAG: electron transfer flavoprotein subunit alpha/FixB family protein [Sterolibacterium sp.]|jgi:electron transfer flavoprotein alpha subunit|nr:electron transfer flavoprotein subunit alpha/FixB family protein [Sterolibacterium sp.]
MSVVLCTWGNTLEGGTREALTLARKTAAAQNLPLHWVVIGPAANDAPAMAAEYGVQGLDVINDAKLAAFGPDALVAALTQYATENKPKIILFNQTAAARLIAPRLAGKLGVPVTMNAYAIAVEGAGLNVNATAFGGDTHVVYQLPAPVNVISIVTTTVVAETAAAPTSPARREIAVNLAAVDERFKVTSPAKIEGPRLEDAQIIVSGGRGLGNAQNYELVKQLADAMGGMWGGSRVIVDEGWITSARQVGLTGKITRPGLYLAAGISGASQHMAGCSAAKTIVAINKDPDASIYRYARYGIVGDCLEVLPELIKLAKA